MNFPTHTDFSASIIDFPTHIIDFQTHIIDFPTQIIDFPTLIIDFSTYIVDFQPILLPSPSYTYWLHIPHVVDISTHNKQINPRLLTIIDLHSKWCFRAYWVILTPFFMHFMHFWLSKRDAIYETLVEIWTFFIKVGLKLGLQQVSTTNGPWDQGF